MIHTNKERKEEEKVKSEEKLAAIPSERIYSQTIALSHVPNFAKGKFVGVRPRIFAEHVLEIRRDEPGIH